MNIEQIKDHIRNMVNHVIRDDHEQAKVELHQAIVKRSQEVMTSHEDFNPIRGVTKIETRSKGEQQR